MSTQRTMKYIYLYIGFHRSNKTSFIKKMSGNSDHIENNNIS